MAFTVSSLPAYVEQNRSKLISAAVLAPKTAALLTLMSGVKGATALNLLNVGVTFANGNACGFSASGDDVLTQRTLTPGIIKVNKSWCEEALRAKYTVHEVETGAGKETLAFEEKILGDIIAKVGAENEKALWQGDKTNGTGNLAFYDGLATLITADITGGSITLTTTAASTDSVYARTRAVYALIPDEALATAVICMSYTNFRKLIMDLVDANLYHYERNIDANMEIILPGTNTRVCGLPGMVGLDRIYAFEPEQVVYGFDAPDDINTFKLWFSDDADEFRFKLKFAAGVQYAFPNRIVVGIPYGGGQ